MASAVPDEPRPARPRGHQLTRSTSSASWRSACANTAAGCCTSNSRLPSGTFFIHGVSSTHSYLLGQLDALVGDRGECGGAKTGHAHGASSFSSFGLLLSSPLAGGARCPRPVGVVPTLGGTLGDGGVELPRFGGQFSVCRVGVSDPDQRALM